MLDGLKKWLQIGGPEYNSPSWAWRTTPLGGRGNVPFDRMPCAEELATLAGVQRCCSLFSDATASQGWGIRQAPPQGGYIKVGGSDAARALELWSYEGREFFLFNCALLGNGYAVLHRNERGGVYDIESVASWRVSLEWSNGALFYRVAEDESLQQPERVLPAMDMLHLKFRVTGKHPLLGVSPLVSLAPALAPLFSMREGQSQVWQWITLPGAYFASEGKMTGDQKDSLRQSFDSLNSGRPVVLEGGLEMKDVPVPALDRLQMLDLSRYGTEEIARAWGVPTSMLSQSEGINYASAAEQSRQFVTVSLQPFARRVESALAEKLLSRNERASGFSVSIDLTQMLLGHGQERSEYFSRMVNAGVMTTNEARNQAGLSDVSGGDVVRMPVNTLPMEQWEQGELNFGGERAAPVIEAQPEPLQLRSVERINRILEHVA